MNIYQIYIKDEAGLPAGARMEQNPDGKIVRVIPDADFAYNQAYYLYITKDLSSAFGKDLKDNIRMRFTIGLP